MDHGYNLAKNFPGLGMGPENFSRYVNEMTCGRMQIKVYGAGEFVPALGVFDAVSQGNVQLGHGASYYWTGKVKSSTIFYRSSFWLNSSGDEWLVALRRRHGALGRGL